MRLLFYDYVQVVIKKQLNKLDWEFQIWHSFELQYYLSLVTYFLQ